MIFFIVSNDGTGLIFIIEDIRNRRNMGLIGDESNVDAYALFIFQSFRQVIPPLLNEIIIA
jgi:hypothetical protein